MNRISIYTDTSKQEEFITRMNEIVNRKNSSIAFCSLEMNGSNGYVILARPYTPRRSQDRLMFNFFSSLYTSNDYEEYVKDGYSKEDITDLSKLLNDFSFENFYEGQFFASKFLNMSGEKLKAYVFKLTTDEKHHEFFIDDKYLINQYSIMKKEKMLELLPKLDINENDELIKSNNFRPDNWEQNFKTSLEIMAEWNSKSIDKTEYVVVEYYYSYDKYHKEYYLNKFWHEKDGQIVCNNLKSVNVDFSPK